MSGLNPDGLGVNRTYGNVESDSVNTEKGPSEVRHASAFEGDNGGEQIQNAIDDLPASGGTVVVGPEGPDDVSASSGSISGPDTAAWEVESDYIYLNPNVTLELHGSYLFASDDLNQGIIRYRDETGTDNVSIEGFGDAIIDGNGSNQNRTSKDRKWITLEFINGNNLELEGFTVRNPAAWSVKARGVDDVTCDLHFDCDGSQQNQDGVHIIGPAENIEIHKTGETIDDDVAIDARDSTSSDAFHTEGGGSIEIVEITGEIRRQIRFAPGDGNFITGYSIDVVSKADDDGQAVVLFSSIADTKNDADEMSNGQIDITARNATQLPCIKVNTPVQNMSCDVVSDRSRVLDVADKAVGISLSAIVRGDCIAINTDESTVVLNVRSLHLENFNGSTPIGFSVGSNTFGRVSSVETWDTSTVYDSVGELEFDGPSVPEFDIEPANIDGHLVKQNGSGFNPTGSGLKELVQYKNGGWVAIA